MKTFVMPLSIELWKRKKKKYWISLNIYRNLHFIVNNNLKIEYKKMLKAQLPSSWKERICSPIELTFTYYNPTKRKSDLENFCAIQNKYFQDALVEMGILEDDNYDFIKKIHYIYGGYEKGKGRIEVTVKEL